MSQRAPSAVTDLESAKSPDSDISPRTVVPVSESSDYFSGAPRSDKSKGKALDVSLADRTRASEKASSPGGSTTTAASTAASAVASSSTDLAQDSRRSSKYDNEGTGPELDSRKSSVASVSWHNIHPKLPQGVKRPTDGKRLRNSSPSPVRFRSHVAFDSLPAGEATKNNTAAFTLNVRHEGYRPKRRSRTFIVGVDEHEYSDYALKWLLESLVDDGDEVVCVRVIESPTRLGERSYQEDAHRILHRIQEKNEKNKAISIILEYSVGKLHATFQHFIQLYQPSMLIVGTRGRSLGGLQGLMTTRNSFSKYCLQYSPVPVVVVRPDDQRKKKKEKRSNDATRQTYAALLALNPSGKHEADSESSSVYALENGISADEEAHRVATAIGLPAAFDPTIKPYSPTPLSQARSSSVSIAGPSAQVDSVPTKQRRSSSPPPLEGNDSDGDESGEDDYEFEVQSGAQLAKSDKKQQDLEREQKERLHAMEMGEAAALLKSGAGRNSEEDEDDDES